MKFVLVLTAISAMLFAENDSGDLSSIDKPAFKYETFDNIQSGIKEWKVNTQLYGQVSLLSGLGASVRIKNEKHIVGCELAATGGIVFHYKIPYPEIGANILVFPKNQHLYFLTGIKTGPIYGVPFAIGAQFDKGFFDVGITFYSTIPIPTLRGGFSF